MTSKAAAATQPGVRAAAEALLVRGNAVDAVCAGVLMAAALEPSVLLGPLHILVSGPGHGLRCVDGRARQPGRGAPRPRGFLSVDGVSSAARVAVPALPAALGTALSMFGTTTLRTALGPALAVLERSHPRRNVLATFGSGGASSLTKDPFADALVSAAGRLASGLLTHDDLRLVRAPVVDCAVHESLAVAPFATGDPKWCQAVCAVDHRGGVAAACYEVIFDGLRIESLDLVAPLVAEPVMRGKRRVDAGAPLPCATTIGLLDLSSEGRFEAAIGFGGRALPAHVDATTLEATLRSHPPSVGVVRGKRARAYSFTP